MKCDFCNNEKTQVVYEHETCSSEECKEKATKGRVGLGISRTKFGRDA